MKRHRFIGSFDLTQNPLRLFDMALVRQITLVLKLKVGEEIVLCDGKGKEAVARITDATKKSVTVEIVSTAKNTNEPSRRVTLYCAILKRENFELVVQKATEVGVAEIVPVLTRRTVKTGLKTERLREIAREAAEQSGRGTVPVVHEAMTFKDAVEDAKKNGENYFLDAGGDPFVLPLGKGETRFGLFVGPEGGWDPSEVGAIHELPQREKFIVASLGSLVLRAETAAVVGTYLFTS